MDKPVLDTAWIEVLVTQKSCIYLLSLYSFKYAERSKSITDWIDENSVSMDRNCGLLEILMWHQNQWLPSSSLHGIHLFLVWLVIYNRVLCTVLYTNCSAYDWRHECTSVYLPILLKSVSLKLLNHFGTFFFFFFFKQGEFCFSRTACEMKCFWLFR